MEEDDLRVRFAFHPATTSDVQATHSQVRELCLWAALEVNELLPDSREKSLAITKLEEAMMWANAGVARHSHE